ncbi:MAG: polyprenyl diphosphate synthase [Candidatus Magasanikbacteria bacterium]
MVETTKNEIKHIAIIMDGNRRWATEHSLPKIIGHTEGSKNVKHIAKVAQDLGIKYLTLWALSTENLKNRSQEELKHLFSLFEKLTEELDASKKNNLRIKIIGDLSKLPTSTQNKLDEVVKKTQDHTGLTLTLAINYGGRDELVRTIRKIVDGKISIDKIDEELIDQFLDTANMPDPELIIRTGGDQRLSGYLPWQSTYAEIYFTPIKWPAFSEENLNEAVQWFEEQKRNRGK